MPDEKPPRRPPPPSSIQRAITEGAKLLDPEDVVPSSSTAETFGDDEPSAVGLPPHRRRATRADITALGVEIKTQVQDWVDYDKAEHTAIRSETATAHSLIRTETAAAITEVKTRLGNLSDKIDENKATNDLQNTNIANKLGDVAVQSAATSAHVQHLVVAVQGDQGAKLRMQTTNAELEARDRAAEKDYRRELYKKFWIGVIGIVLAIGGALAEHYVIHPKGEASPPPAAKTDK